MGYYLTISPDRPPARPLATPKTHTPASQVQERGHRYYSPGLGRWANRDPIYEPGFERGFETARNVNHGTDSQQTLQISEQARSLNLFSFIDNRVPGSVDVLGLSHNDPPPCAPYPDCLPHPLPPLPPGPPNIPPAPIMPPSAPWWVCCRRVYGWQSLTHCDLRQEPGDPGSTCYSVRRDPNCCNNKIKTELDMSICLLQHHTASGRGCIGDNCQSSTIAALKACCATSSQWDPSWYAYPLWSAY